MTDPDTDVPEPIEISYTTGYSSFDEIPRSTLQAIKVLGYHLFMNNESEEIPNAYKDLAGQAKLMNIRCLDNV